jgi:hemoglobin
MSDKTSSSRCYRVVPGAPLGINEDTIKRLVDDFYARVCIDPAIGPIFSARITDWEPHLETMRDFWSSVVLMSGKYKGKPIAVHIALGLRPTHFARWLHLFEQSAVEVCTPHAAELFIDRAHKIALSLRRGLNIGVIESGDLTDPQPEMPTSAKHNLSP